MSKWMKVDPATLKVGDEVRWVVEITGGRVIREIVVSEVCPRYIRLGLAYIAPGNGTWYVRKPKKAKPDSEPADGHSAHYWRNKYAKQLNHNERLQAVNKGRAAKLKEAEARLTLKLEETQSQLDDSMMTIDRKNSELTNLRRVLADLQNSDATYDRVEAQAQLQDAWATIDNQAAKIDKWKTKAVALAKQMRADRRDAEPTRPDEPERIGSVVSVVVPNVSYPTYYVRRFTRTDKDDCAPWMDLRSLDEHDWHSVVHGYGTPVEVTVVSEGVPNE